MRSFGRLPVVFPRAWFLFTAAAVCIGTALPPAHAQTAPQLIPYTMSTYAGPNAAVAKGAACGNYIALDPLGDGCLATAMSVGPDPHDIRVDSKGNVYWIDNLTTALTVIHKINPFTRQVTVFIGNDESVKACTNSPCPANDAAANNTANYTFLNKNQRGMAVSAQGDVYLAGYNDDYIHKVSAATGLYSNAAGTGAATSGTNYGGPITTTGIASVRGVGVDSYGNIYIAETANNLVVVACVAAATTIPSPCAAANVGNLVQLTATNTNAIKDPSDGKLATSQQLAAPEDVQIDSNGNIYIADQSNGILRVIYEGKGTVPVTSTNTPQTGFIYNVAGTGGPVTAGSANSVYPSGPYANGFPPVYKGTSVPISLRKISIDALNNVYIADSTENVVWFLDNATGYMRLIAGQLGVSGGTPAPGCPAAPTTSTNTLGDGCPGPSASVYFNYGGTNTDGANAVDNQGNLYMTDAEGGAAATSRIRKLLSGLNFPSATLNTTLTQNIFLHFGVGDTFASIKSSNADFQAGAPSCNSNATGDNTSDCIVPINYRPTAVGAETSTLTVTTAAKLTSTFLLTGTGLAPQFLIDPGNIVTVALATTNPQAIFFDGSNNAYIADTGNNRILYVASGAGTFTVLAGSPTGVAGSSGDGGPATAALLKAPRAVAVDSAHNVYIADTGNNRVRVINASTNIITTFAGGGSGTCTVATDALGDLCPATSAILSAPAGVAADNIGGVYIADSGNNLIRQVSLSGTITLLAGGGSGSCTNPIGSSDAQGDGCPALAAVLSAPSGLFFDPVGNFLFVADTGNSLVRKVYLGTVIPQTVNYLPAAVQVNPITQVAGNGSAGSSPNPVATQAQLNKPTGIYVDAAENVYIADTQNSAVRLVDFATGNIYTIAGIIGASGIDATLPNTANDAQLNLPSSVSLISGNLIIADAANNRLLSVSRANINYDFGRVNVPTTGSPVVTFTQTSVGNLPAMLASPAYTSSGDTSQFVFSTPGMSTGCTAGTTYAIGTSCQYTGQFVPTAAQATPYSATYTETNANTVSIPSINLIGTGAVLTPTNPTVIQTAPAGSPQYGQPVTLSVTVNATCNNASPSGCYPTGSVRFIINGTAGSPINIPSGTNTVTLSNVTSLVYGQNTISCSYSGDFYYAAGACPNINIVVVQATTTSKLTATGSGQVQFPTNNCSATTTNGVASTTCVDAVLTATVMSSTIGIPSGTVTFYYAPAAGGTPVAFTNGTNIPINNSNGQAVLSLNEVVYGNGTEASNNTLPPGSYTLTCAYTGNANSPYANSACPGIPFTVLPDPAGIASIAARGCSITILSQLNTVTPVQNASCSFGNPPSIVEQYYFGTPPSCQAPSSSTNINGLLPCISTADGASTDAAVFLNVTNTLSGTLTFKCSGLPQYAACTFSPTSIALSPSTAHVIPVYTDVTIFTDVPPSNSSALAWPTFGSGHDGVALAQLGVSAGLLWPFSAFTLATLVLFRRRLRSLRGVALLGVAMLLTGGALGLSGCAGPGAYKPVLTPAGQYLITVTATNGTVSASTNFYLQVSAPGITGQQ